MDILDRAQIVEERERMAGIAGVRASLPTGESATHCAMCGEEIPEGRRNASPGCIYCVVCQAEME